MNQMSGLRCLRLMKGEAIKREQKIHLVKNGIQVCFIRHGFLNKNLTSEDVSQVTCRYCLTGVESREWRESLGKAKTIFNCSNCGKEKGLIRDVYNQRLRKSKTKRLYCSYACSSAKNGGSRSLVSM